MITPANRAVATNEYYFSKKLKELDQLHKDDQPMINLGIGSPDLEPDPSISETLINALSAKGSYQYKAYNGLPELRESMVQWYSNKYNVELNAENEIIPLMGSKEGIGYVSLAYLQEGDSVLTPDPGYPAYESAAKIAGARVIKYNLREENSWYPDIDELEELVDKKCKMIWVNYPNMPTTSRGTELIFKQLIDFALRNNLIICNDNPYGLILSDKSVSILSINNSCRCAIELNSLSKLYNMAGARIGMLAGAESLLHPVFKIQSSFSSGMFEPIQKAAVNALLLDESWERKLNKVYRERKALAFQLLDELNCTYSKDGVGLFVWGKVSDSYGKGELLVEYLLSEARVFVTPGSVFGENGQKHIRVSLCADLETFKEAIQRIQSIQSKKNTK